MGDLLNREMTLQIGGTLIRSRIGDRGEEPLLRTRFNVVRTLKKEPNKAEISIFNLNSDHRVEFQDKGIPVILKAGYVGSELSRIFSGELDFGSNVQNGTDWITTLQTADGGQQYRGARITLSMAGPVGVGDVLRRAADALGIKAGNLEEKILVGSKRKLTQFINGIVMSGKAEKEISRLLKSMGYGWSIQDGKFQILEPGESFGTTKQLISPGTGMIGSPQPGEKGFINVRSLIQPNLLPGNEIDVQSNVAQGTYRIEKVTFSGDTHAQSWYADIEASTVTVESSASA